MPHDDHNNIVLTDEEVAELLEPIADHHHCWSYIAKALIEQEKVRRFAAEKSKRKLGLYGEWPKDGH